MGAATRIGNRMVMGTTGGAGMACPSCRGQGWKFRRSRRTLGIGTLIRAAAEAVRPSCLDWGGTGPVADGVPGVLVRHLPGLARPDVRGLAGAGPGRFVRRSHPGRR